MGSAEGIEYNSSDEELEFPAIRIWGYRLVCVGCHVRWWSSGRVRPWRKVVGAWMGRRERMLRHRVIVSVSGTCVGEGGMMVTRSGDDSCGIGDKGYVGDCESQ
ncbi:hypothetical protein ACFE04_022067 [Oxalis oulophora]